MGMFDKPRGMLPPTLFDSVPEARQQAAPIWSQAAALPADALSQWWEWRKRVAAEDAQKSVAQRAEEAAMGFVGGLKGEGEGILAYHGSPHSFDRFDMGKIGTGEGAQAYGHGLYFTDTEAVARGYKNKLTGTNQFGNGNTVPMNIDGTPVTARNWVSVQNDMWAKGDQEGAALAQMLGDANRYNVQSMGALKKLYKQQPSLWSQDYRKQFAKPSELSGDALAGLDEAFKRARERAGFAPPRGSMYQVRINADPNTMLDWDKPLPEQGPAVRAVDDAFWAQKKHPDIVNFMKSPEGAQAMRDAGIPGIKYLDQGSRAAGDGTRNYVVFDDKLIDILKKYGLAGLLAGGGAGAGLTGSGGQQ